METQEELREKYNPEGSDLRRMQLRMLDMLKEVDKICCRHNISYWLAAGTLLGAVRHGGFIPWDDDLDIELMRKDYFKLLKHLKQELPACYKIQTHKTDRCYFNLHAKVRDVNTELTEANDLNRYLRFRGVFIDIFPMESCYFIFQKPLSYMYYIFVRKYASLKSSITRWAVLTLFWNILNFLCSALRIAKPLSKNQSISHSYGIYFAFKCNKKTLFPLSEIEFEGHLFKAPHCPEQYLVNAFGDYMQLPPEKDRVVHSTGVRFMG